jgi:LacI family transcriptional regulator
MRDRVSAAMAQLHYRPRIAARAMRGHNYTIGIEIPDFGNQFFSRMLTGASAALANTPYQIVIAPAEAGSMQGLRAIEALVDRQVDAIIVVSPRVPQSELEEIGRDTPVVMFGRHDLSDVYDTVAGDDLGGTAAAMTHLFDLGHRRIAHLTLDDLGASPGAPHDLRFQGYRNAMHAAGLTPTPILQTQEGQGAAYGAVRAALAEGLDATAIFAAHDELALGASRAIQEAGADISLVGYDDVPIASHPALNLTTMYQPGHEMGVRAIELILERLQGRIEPAREIFAPELKVRGSTRRIRVE